MTLLKLQRKVGGLNHLSTNQSKIEFQKKRKSDGKRKRDGDRQRQTDREKTNDYFNNLADKS